MDDQARLERLRKSQRHTHRRVEKSLLRLDAVSRKREAAPSGGDLQPAAAALLQIFAHLGVEGGGERLASSSGDSQGIPDLARQAGGRARLVILEEGWQRKDLGPMIGVLGGTEAPDEGRVVALIHDGRRYRYTDHASGEQGTVDNDLADRIRSSAYSIYPPLPEQPERLWPLLRFMWPEVRRDLGPILVAGALIALLGALIPLATARGE